MNDLITQDTETQRFELAQREAKALQTSDLLPAQYKNNLGNILIALEYSRRLDMPPLAVMQSIYIVNGKPGLNAQIPIAMIIRKYGQINYELSGEGDDQSCHVWVRDPLTGEKITGSSVSIALAKKEGWLKNSKWVSMPEQMLKYRAASFFGRVYLADVLLGMQTIEELQDIEIDPATGEVKTITTRGVKGLRQRLGGGDEQ